MKKEDIGSQKDKLTNKEHEQQQDVKLMTDKYDIENMDRAWEDDRL
ncbi:hypothetical protein [Litchfieldia alkalitelluris]|nr:hypothetical protein [Litchfieldia alkalitelluris]